MSSPISSYATASMEASLAPSSAHRIKWSLPSSGPEDYPPSVGPDEYTIINPNFWAEGVEAAKFKGWSNLSEWANNLHLEVQPKWLVICQSVDHYYLWCETHKDLAHQLKELQKVEQRVLYIERELNALALKEEGVKERLAALEATDTRFRGLVLKIVRNLTTHSAQLNLFWQIISSLLLPRGPVGGRGTGPPHDATEPEGDSGSGSPSSSCPSLISLQSSWLDSPTLNTPANPSRANSSGMPSEEDDWLQTTLLSVSSAAVENGGSTGLPGGGGPIWNMGGGTSAGGRDGDVPDPGESQHSGLPEL